jgi:hypothetical protein
MERMVAFLTMLAYLGGFGLISFAAALLLCSPVLFQQLPRRERMRLPPLAEASASNEARESQPVEPKAGRPGGTGVLTRVCWPFLTGVDVHWRVELLIF